MYRPADFYSDDEDEYEGFYFNDEFDKKPRVVNNWLNEQEIAEKEMVKTISNNDLQLLKKQIALQPQFDVNKVMRDGNTLLNIACSEGRVDVVHYLLNGQKANVNMEVDSMTPLLYACSCSADKSKQVNEIVQMLLKHDAVINVSNKYALTPLILACQNKHVGVVRQLIQYASLESQDHAGCTPLFHAVKANQAEIVQMLVQAGAKTTIENIKGYTPWRVAEFYGFYDLLELLPKPKEEYFVPATFLSYHTLQDWFPRLFLKSECPEYFQEIYKILKTLQMQHVAEYFAKGHVTFEQFLCMNDERLQQLGIMLSVHRNKILKGLLDFHLHHWSKRSVAYNRYRDFYELLMIAANHMQHLLIVKSAFQFAKQQMQQSKFGQISERNLLQLQDNLLVYRSCVNRLKMDIQRLITFLPHKNPIYIDYDEYLAERKRRRLKRYVLRTSLIVGFSVCIVYWKIQKYF